MKKVSYDDIFVVLTYRNTTDVIDFLDSLRGKIERYKVVIVNSYFDDITYSCIRKIAYEYGCDFINIQNKGYGYGNNKGIEYVKKMYNFKRVVISNPDIIVREYNQNKLDEFKDGIIGGDIVCRNGKHQNPLRVTNLSISLYAAYYLYSMNSKLRFLIGIVIAKLRRWFFLQTINTYKNVFALHGSFFIITKNTIEKYDKIFDENIFMFFEEIDLAKRFEIDKVPVRYVTFVNVYHKEDGSISISDINESLEMRKSCCYVFDKYCR